MPAPGERAAAKQEGRPRYFTGKPCPRGHIADRRTSNAACVDCCREEMRTEESKARAKAYRQENAERLLASKREHYRNNRHIWVASGKRRQKRYAEDPAARAAAAERRRAQRDYQSAYNKRYAIENRERLSAISRNYKARKRGAAGRHTAQDIERIYARQGGRCAYCQTGLADGYHVDHAIPLAKGGSNWPSNLQLACPPCNLSKRDMMPAQFMEFLRIVGAARGIGA